MNYLIRIEVSLQTTGPDGLEPLMYGFLDVEDLEGYAGSVLTEHQLATAVNLIIAHRRQRLCELLAHAVKHLTYQQPELPFP